MGVIAYYEVRWRREGGAGAWNYAKAYPDDPVVTLPGVTRGDEFQIEARSVAPSGKHSEWVQQTHIVADVLPLIPNDDLTATALADGVHLAWTVPDGQRPDVEYEIQRTGDISGAPDGANWATVDQVRAFAYTDAVTDGVARWYQIRAVTANGRTSGWRGPVCSVPKIVNVENGSFEASSVLPPPGWGTYLATLAYETANPQNGSRSLKVMASAQFGSARATHVYAVKPGEVWRVSGWIASDGTSFPRILLLVVDKDGAYLTSAAGYVGAGMPGVWTYVSGSVVIPAGGVSGYLALDNGHATGAGVCWFDGVDCAPQLASTFQQKPVNAAGIFTGSNPLSNSGTSHVIQVNAFTIQWGSGQVSYNSGSVNPGAYGTWYVYCDDPGYQGGAVTFYATSNPVNVYAGDGRIYLGKITTVNGAGGTGGGGDGGPTCFTGKGEVETPEGWRAFESLPSGIFHVLTGEGETAEAELLVHDHDGLLLDIGGGVGSTAGHHFKSGSGPDDYEPAARFFPGAPQFEFKGKVFNLHVFHPAHNYRLRAGERVHVVHNLRKI